MSRSSLARRCSGPEQRWLQSGSPLLRVGRPIDGPLSPMVRQSGTAIAALVPAGDAARRESEARRIVLVGAVAAAILVVGAGAANPLATTRWVLLGLGAGVEPFVPLFFATRIPSRIPSTNGGRPATLKWPWLSAACGVTLVMWFGFGPGIRLS